MIYIIGILLTLIAVILFGLVIFIHEFGHFFTAKLAGVKVNEFAIGMGPKLIRFKKGETNYTLRLFPIGGFCSMEGEDEESSDEGAFNNKPVLSRIIIVSMGAIMNIIFGFLLMMILLAQKPAFPSNTIVKFADTAVSNQYGLEVGDKILSVNGYKIMTDRDLTFALGTDNDFCVDMTVLRNGSKVNLSNVRFGTQNTEDGKEILALDFYVEPIKNNFFTLISQSVKSTISMVKMVWASLIGLITGKFGFSDMAGPIGAASAITEAASLGLKVNFLNAVNNIILMMVIITVNLGIVNLLPFPALDGGRLVFLIIEGIRKKPISAKYEGYVHAAGFAILITFMLVITFSDVLKLITGKGIGV